MLFNPDEGVEKAKKIVEKEKSAKNEVGLTKTQIKMMLTRNQLVKAYR